MENGSIKYDSVSVKEDMAGNRAVLTIENKVLLFPSMLDCFIH